MDTLDHITIEFYLVGLFTISTLSAKRSSNQQETFPAATVCTNPVGLVQLFDNVDASMSYYREEIFGPVLCVMRCASYLGAVDLIHGHEFANGTAIFTRGDKTDIELFRSSSLVQPKAYP